MGMNAPLVVTHPEPIKLTVEDYLLLDSSGALAAHGKTELIDGVIYLVSPQHSPHYKLKTRLLRRLADAADALGTGMEAWVEGSLDFRPLSCPEPDIFVTSRTPQADLTEGDIVLLAIEVSSTSLAFDLGKKAAMYAQADVPEYWVVDVAGGSVHRMWAPGPDGYAERDEVRLGERLESVTVPGLGVDAAGLI